MEEKNKAQNDIYELQVVSGIRAMLGDDKQREKMETLKNENLAMFEQVMSEAENRYNTMVNDNNRDPNEISNELVVRSLLLKLKILFREGPSIFIKLSKSLLKLEVQLIITLVKLLPSLFKRLILR